MTKVYKIEIMVIDDDQLGVDEINSVIENARYPNRCITPKVVNSESRSIAWSDDHPLNQRSTWRTAYERLFSTPEPPEPKCWCGEPASPDCAGVLDREWCRPHAPRCPSGAHFLGNCLCGAAPVPPAQAMPKFTGIIANGKLTGVITRCSVPMCGESGVCDECRAKGAR